MSGRVPRVSYTLRRKLIKRKKRLEEKSAGGLGGGEEEWANIKGKNARGQY